MFLIDDAAHLKSALSRYVCRFPVRRHRNRKSVERVLREVKRRTFSFSNTFRNVGPMTAESWLEAFDVCGIAIGFDTMVPSHGKTRRPNRTRPRWLQESVPGRGSALDLLESYCISYLERALSLLPNSGHGIWNNTIAVTYPLRTVLEAPKQTEQKLSLTIESGSPHLTVTLLARFRGLSISRPLSFAT